MSPDVGTSLCSIAQREQIQERDQTSSETPLSGDEHACCQVHKEDLLNPIDFSLGLRVSGLKAVALGVAV